MPYIGEIRMFGGNFPPLDWALCNGQSLNISEYDILYTLIGTTYGGDGINTFNVPDLQSRIPVGQGTSALGTFTIGQTGGTETNTLTTAQMPAHSHTLSGSASILVSSEDGHRTAPGGGTYLGVNGQNAYSTTTDGSQMAAVSNGLTASIAGSSQPITNVQPYLAVNYIICIQGIYPTT